jgi:hypothetical protein
MAADPLNPAFFAPIDRALLESSISAPRASLIAHDRANQYALSNDHPRDERPNSDRLGVRRRPLDGILWYSNTTRPIGASGSEDMSQDREDHAASRHAFPIRPSC